MTTSASSATRATRRAARRDGLAGKCRRAGCRHSGGSGPRHARPRSGPDRKRGSPRHHQQPGQLCAEPSPGWSLDVCWTPGSYLYQNSTRVKYLRAPPRCSLPFEPATARRGAYPSRRVRTRGTVAPAVGVSPVVLDVFTAELPERTPGELGCPERARAPWREGAFDTRRRRPGTACWRGRFRRRCSPPRRCAGRRSGARSGL